MKTGTGTQTLTGTSTYTGGTTLTAGVLSVSATANLGAATSPITFNGGTLQVTGTTFTAVGHTVNWSPAGGTFDINTAANTFTVNSPLSGGGLTKVGPGSLVLAQNFTTSSPTVISAGFLTLGGTANNLGIINGAGTLTVSAGTKVAPGLTSDGILVNTLIINGSVRIRTNGTATGTSLIQAFTLGTSGSLDLTNNKLIVEATSNFATTFSALQSEVLAGTLYSSTLPANMGVAVFANSALVPQKTTFGGQPADSNSIFVASELLGDANVDGHVDLNDLDTVLNNLGSATSLWTSGNFDNASTIDLNDLNDVLNNLGTNFANSSSVIAAESLVAATPTPEPASLSLLAFALPLLLRKRRQH